MNLFDFIDNTFKFSKKPISFGNEDILLKLISKISSDSQEHN